MDHSQWSAGRQVSTYRQGMSNKRILYLQEGDDPAKSDPMVATCFSDEDAAMIVKALNTPNPTLMTSREDQHWVDGALIDGSVNAGPTPIAFDQIRVAPEPACTCDLVPRIGTHHAEFGGPCVHPDCPCSANSSSSESEPTSSSSVSEEVVESSANSNEKLEQVGASWSKGDVLWWRDQIWVLEFARGDGAVNDYLIAHTPFGNSVEAAEIPADTLVLVRDGDPVVDADKYEDLYGVAQERGTQIEKLTAENDKLNAHQKRLTADLIDSRRQGPMLIVERDEAQAAVRNMEADFEEIRIRLQDNFEEIRVKLEIENDKLSRKVEKGEVKQAKLTKLQAENDKLHRDYEATVQTARDAQAEIDTLRASLGFMDQEYQRQEHKIARLRKVAKARKLRRVKKNDPEPAEGSLVLDKYQRGWKRIDLYSGLPEHSKDARWRYLGQVLTWPDLIKHYGPVRLIHDGGQP